VLKKALPINETDTLKAFVRLIHGEYANKIDIIDQFNQKYSTCSKNSIEKKIADIAQKKKLEGEKKPRWIVNEDTFKQLNIMDEYETILKIKFEEQRKEQERKEFEKKEEERKEKEKEKEKDKDKENIPDAAGIKKGKKKAQK